jgi:hypothetical protein
MTYLELVNNVLRRLRESEVSSVVTGSSYAKMVATFVNDAKRQVENAYDWNALSTTVTVPTVADTFEYAVTGAGTRFKVLDVLNNTSDLFVNVAPTHWMNYQFALSPAQRGAPTYYAFKGTNNSGDTKVRVFPVPDGVYSLDFNIIKPQAELTADADVMLVPFEPVVFLAYAKALAERGEDGGLASSEAYGLYKSSLADHVAIESGRNADFDYWVEV